MMFISQTSSNLKAARLFKPCTLALIANLSFPCRVCHRFEEDDACRTATSLSHSSFVPQPSGSRIERLFRLCRAIVCDRDAAPRIYTEPSVNRPESIEDEATSKSQWHYMPNDFPALNLVIGYVTSL